MKGRNPPTPRIALALAGGGPLELCASFIENDPSAGDVFDPAWLMVPADRFEPDPRDPKLYLANTFSYGQHRELAEHAYQQTRALLRSRRRSLGVKLARHGLSLRAEVLDDTNRHWVTPPEPRAQLGRAIASPHQVLDPLGQAIPPASVQAA